MSHLPENWFISDVFDIEYKTYQILDYVQKTNAHFERNELFPYFDYLLRHMHVLDLFRAAKKEMDSGIFEHSKSLHFYNPQRKKTSISESISDLNEILAFAHMHFQKCRTKGEQHLAMLYQKLCVSEVGILNPSASGGLIIINQKETSRIYTYEHRLIRRPNMFFQYKDVKTCFTRLVSTSAQTNALEIKWRFLKSDKFNTGINTYLVETEEEIPHFETIIPLVKNQLMLSSGAWLF